MNIDSAFFNPAASLQTNAGDYARFLLSLVKGKGVSKSSFQELIRPQTDHPLTGYFSRYKAWGLGFAIAGKDDVTYLEHTGNNGNFQSGFSINLKTQSGYVFFTNCDRGDVFEEKLRLLLTY